MSGIEKVCEFSGDYPGHDMYDMKRNHIQIASKYRKDFRGKKATLYIFKSSDVITDGTFTQDADFSCINPNPTDEDWDSYNADFTVRFENGSYHRYSVFYQNLDEYKAELKNRHQRLVTEYKYILVVPDMPGEVSGKYINFSTEKSSVVRRLKRLVGSRNLTIKNVDPEFQE